jgi:hypothetical protein
MVGVTIRDIGKCQHCKKVICIWDIPRVAWEDPKNGAFLPCPKCRKWTDPWYTWGRSHDRDTGKSTYRYIGIRGKWVKHMPRRDFKMGKYLVKVDPQFIPKKAKRPEVWPTTT